MALPPVKLLPPLAPRRRRSADRSRWTQPAAMDRLGGDDGGAAAGEGLVDKIATGAAVDESAGAWPRPGLLGAVHRCRRPPGPPWRSTRASHWSREPCQWPLAVVATSVEAGLVLPADNRRGRARSGAWPRDLRTDPAKPQASRLSATVRAWTPRVPDVGDVAREQRPGLAPASATVVVRDLAGARRGRDPGRVAPRGIVGRPRRAGRSPSGAARHRPAAARRRWRSWRRRRAGDARPAARGRRDA